MSFVELEWMLRVLPYSWKRSLIIAILKHGKDSTVATSYRPVGLTSCLSILMERMTNNTDWLIGLAS